MALNKACILDEDVPPHQNEVFSSIQKHEHGRDAHKSVLSYLCYTLSTVGIEKNVHTHTSTDNYWPIHCGTFTLKECAVKYQSKIAGDAHQSSHKLQGVLISKTKNSPVEYLREHLCPPVPTMQPSSEVQRYVRS